MRFRLILIAGLLCLCYVTVNLADQIAITADGKKVNLKDDGTWEYAEKENVPKKKTDVKDHIRREDIEKKFALRTIESWVGEQFIFLSTQKDYKLLKGKQDEKYNSFDINTWFIILPYKEYVGRIGMIRSVTKEDLSSSKDWIIEIEMTDTKEKLFVKTQIGKIPGMGPVTDIDKAREICLGKSLWCKYKGMSLSAFGESNGEGESIRVPGYSPLRVTDVAAGKSNMKPVRFVLATPNGAEGYIDIDLSGTNASGFSRQSPLEEIFLINDPQAPIRGEFDFRKTKWGMTKAEVEKTEKGKPVYGEENYIGYESQVMSMDCYSIYFFVEDRLVRGKYVFNYPHANRNLYLNDRRSVFEKLKLKYGEPFSDETYWSDDLYRDDPNDWGMALAVGDLSFYASWQTNETDITLALYGDNYKVTFAIEYRSRRLKKLEDKASDKAILDDL